MMKQNKNSNYFFQLFSKIFILVLLTILVLSLAVYFFLAQSTLGILYKSEINIFSHIKTTINYIDDTLKSSILAIINNKSVTQLLTAPTDDYTQTSDSFKEVSFLLDNNKFLHSIYIYNGMTDTYFVIGKDNAIEKGDFYDSEAVHMQEAKAYTDFSAPVFRSIPAHKITPDKTVPVFTYFLPESYTLQSEYQNCIFINVSANEIYKYFSQNDKNTQNEENTSSLLLIDDEGNVVGLPDSNLFTKNLREDKSIARILDGNTDSGVFITDFNNAKSVVSFFRVESPRWFLVNVTPYQSFNAPIRTLRQFLLLIAVLSGIICIILTYLTSKNLYFPIKSIGSKITKISENKNGEGISIHSLSELVDAIGDKINFLEGFHTNFYNMAKNDSMRNLLLGITTSKNIDISSLNFAITKTREKIALYIIKIDQYEDFAASLSTEDQFLYKYGLINIAKELTEALCRCEFVDMGSDQIVAVLNLEPSEVSEKKLKEILLNIQTAYWKYFNISLSAFISNYADSISALPEEYKQTNMCSAYRLILGHKCIVSNQEVFAIRLSDAPLDDKLVQRLIKSIQESSEENSLRILSEITDTMRHMALPVIYASLKSLSTSLFYYLMTLEQDNSVKFGIDYINFTKNLNALETLSDIENVLKESLISIHRTLKEPVASKKGTAVDSVLAYINEQYSDINLSSKSIADKIGISTRYLNQIFFAQTNKSLQVYITEFRVKKAKELLKETDMTIEQIVSSVGGTNLKYFYKVFKKQTGLTPNQYRNKHHREKQ